MRYIRLVACGLLLAAGLTGRDRYTFIVSRCDWCKNDLHLIEPVVKVRVAAVLEAGPPLKPGEALQCTDSIRESPVTFSETGETGNARELVLICGERRLRLVALQF